MPTWKPSKIRVFLILARPRMRDFHAFCVKITHEHAASLGASDAALPRTVRPTPEGKTTGKIYQFDGFGPLEPATVLGPLARYGVAQPPPPASAVQDGNHRYTARAAAGAATYDAFLGKLKRKKPIDSF
jgi:hypothetical protein